MIALIGTYAQVVNYVIAMDCIFFGLTCGLSLCFATAQPGAGKFSRARTSVDNAFLHRRGVADGGQHFCP